MVVLSLGTQSSCHTTARRLQSSRTTAGPLVVTCDNKIDLAGSEGLEGMKVVNIKLHRPFHLLRWSRCDLAMRTVSTPCQAQSMCGVIGNTPPTSHLWMPWTGPQKEAVTPVKSQGVLFDAGTAWRQCSSASGHIRDQSSCGSCWASAAPKPSMTGAASPRTTPHRCQSRTSQPIVDYLRAFPWTATVVNQGRLGSGSRALASSVEATSRSVKHQVQVVDV